MGSPHAIPPSHPPMGPVETGEFALLKNVLPLRRGVSSVIEQAEQELARGMASPQGMGGTREYVSNNHSGAVVARTGGVSPRTASWPVVVAADSKKSPDPSLSQPPPPPASSKSTPPPSTAPTSATDDDVPSVDHQRPAKHVDGCGFEIRNCDVAADVLASAVSRLPQDRPFTGWAVAISETDIEVGMPDQFSLDYAHEYVELSLLEALAAEGHPNLRVRWSLAPKPPPPKPPRTWSKEQCVAWLRQRGDLDGSASEKNLRAFWKDAQHIPPADLMQACRSYRRDRSFEERNWPLAVFICDAVYKSRLPVRQDIARPEARR
jgi:hypothetical protein